MKRYIVQRPVRHNGERFEVGQEMTGDKLSDEHAAPLVACGAVLEVPADDVGDEGDKVKGKRGRKAADKGDEA